MRRWFHILTALSLLTIPALAQEAAPGDFSTGVRVDSAGGQAVVAVEVPDALYQSVTRSDLGDVRVFNALQEEIPHAIDRARIVRNADPSLAEVPFFPIYGRDGDADRALRVQVRRTPAGTLVDVEGGAVMSSEAAIQSYVIDASRLESPIEEIQVAWADDAPDFVSEVVVERSDDLTTWQRWSATATLAHLQYGGDVLRRATLPVPQGRPAYVRLRWPGDEAPAPLERVTLQTTPASVIERRWATFDAEEVEPGVYRFDLGGVFPVEQVRVALPQQNTLARVELRSAADVGGPWPQRFTGTLYRVQVEGSELESPTLDVRPTTDRYWELRVDQTGGGLGQGMPRLEAGWRPERLLFLARGAGPYTIAFGSYTVEPSAFDAPELLRLVPGGRDAILESTPVTASMPFSLGGGGPPDAPPIPWPRILLWGVLGLGVALLAVLAMRLLRQIERESGAATPSEP